MKSPQVGSEELKIPYDLESRVVPVLFVFCRELYMKKDIDAEIADKDEDTDTNTDIDLNTDTDNDRYMDKDIDRTWTWKGHGHGHRHRHRHRHEKGFNAEMLMTTDTDMGDR